MHRPCSTLQMMPPMQTHHTGMPGVLSPAAVFALIFALAVTHAANLAVTDCSAPVASGGLGYCGPSQVRVCVFRARPPSRRFAVRSIRSRYFVDMHVCMPIMTGTVVVCLVTRATNRILQRWRRARYDGSWRRVRSYYDNLLLLIAVRQRHELRGWMRLLRCVHRRLEDRLH